MKQNSAISIPSSTDNVVKPVSKISNVNSPRTQPSKNLDKFSVWKLRSNALLFVGFLRSPQCGTTLPAVYLSISVWDSPTMLLEVFEFILTFF